MTPYQISKRSEEWNETTSLPFLFHLLKIGAFCGAGVGKRKTRLLGCAGVRMVWDLLPDERYRHLIEHTEQQTIEPKNRVKAHASVLVISPDQLAFNDAIGQGTQALLLLGDERITGLNVKHIEVVVDTVRPATRPKVSLEQVAYGLAQAEHLSVMHASQLSGRTVRVAHREKQLLLVRDIFGNPFAPWQVEPQWQTSAVLSLARAIHGEYAFERLPILADALEEAGCTDEAVLHHCRAETVHARGCWVVDGVLGQTLTVPGKRK